MVFIKDAETLRFVRVNNACERVTGYSKQELIGKSDFDFFPEEQANWLVGQDRNVLKDGKMVDLPEEKIQTRRLGERIFHTQKIPLLGPDGRPAYLLGVSDDVTERLHYQGEIELKNQELEQRNREVVRANLLKSQFLASMSHELRTPLNAILDLSKIEAGQVDLKVESFLVEVAVPEVVSNIRPLLMEKKISLTSRIEPELVVMADRLRFKQILYNLLSNAVKFTPMEGQVSIEASRSGDQAQFALIDNGIGIDPQHQHIIFEEFRQVESPNGTVKEGTGLGLAITRKLLEQQGGKITVESELGKGAKFIFTLPLGQSSA